MQKFQQEPQHYGEKTEDTREKIVRELKKPTSFIIIILVLAILLLMGQFHGL